MLSTGTWLASVQLQVAGYVERELFQLFGL